MRGYGQVWLIPAGWSAPEGAKPAEVTVQENHFIVAKQGSRGYFANKCNPGFYNNSDYLSLDLRGKRFRYTTDLAGASCGCNGALYLSSMRHNTRPTECGDHYCDASSVCGAACAEIDLQQGNQFAWLSSLHTARDSSGAGAGFGGGGERWSGPRDWGAEDYGPDSKCVNTSWPFQVEVSFPVDKNGMLTGMKVMLSQGSQSCLVHGNVHSYKGLAKLSASLAEGMTPVVSYWSSDDMEWLDGKGEDGRGPCASQSKAVCADRIKFYDFGIEPLEAEYSEPYDCTAGFRNWKTGWSDTKKKWCCDYKSIGCLEDDVAPQGGSAGASSGQGATCPGTIQVHGYRNVSLVPAGWKQAGDMARVEVQKSHQIISHMGSRVYLAEACQAGVYDNKQYLAMNLLGKTLKYTTDLAGAGCGCNAALYLTSMRQNQHPSNCNDFYCDASNVCGESCAEIDIQEANAYAWHSTLHTAADTDGVGAGFGGGGKDWTGPREWSSEQYGPVAKCIDTTAPFQVAVSFPVHANGSLRGIQVTLSQLARSCPLRLSITDYEGMEQLSHALSQGMTPVVSYWSSDDNLWLDGRGMDGKGPCGSDSKTSCVDTVKFYGFSVENIREEADAVLDIGKDVSAAQARAECPGDVRLDGYGRTSLVPAGWSTPTAGKEVSVLHNGLVAIGIGGRAYFADKCSKGVYDHDQYIAPKLLGRRMRYSVDLSGAGCGCNAALSLASMRQNRRPGNSTDYYCDAKSSGGVACAEVDVQEANQYAWHSTFRASDDHEGVNAGYGGGDEDSDGPRDWSKVEYGPGAKCIDTSFPFHVMVDFTINDAGTLKGIEVTLSQEGKSCPLSLGLNMYKGMDEMSTALEAGMTPVLSYWTSDDMLWLDGVGKDGKGGCEKDHESRCGESVKFYDFAIEDISSSSATTPSGARAACPAKLPFTGYGNVSLVPTGWPALDHGLSVAVQGNGRVVPSLGSRAYFADECTAGKYDNEQYLAPNLLGKRMRYSLDLSGAGCGCNVAFYLTSMRQNNHPSKCGDYYCDANSVCGESCAEIDIQEANMFAWHSTLHTADDSSGVGAGYGGGGKDWSGPRDWTHKEYGPDGKCINTSAPFDVAVDFLTGQEGSLQAMKITLSQAGSSCPRSVTIDQYRGMAELSQALMKGMTPVLSYWSSKDLTWLDGKGKDGQGPCSAGSEANCGQNVKFYNFSIEELTDVTSDPFDCKAGLANWEEGWSSTKKVWCCMRFELGCKKEGEVPSTWPSTTPPLRPPVKAPECPGHITMGGYGNISVIPSGWNNGDGGAEIAVAAPSEVRPHAGGQAYFANTCTAGTYDRKQYLALNLLGKRLRYTTDLSEAGCGCRALVSLASMRQNPKPSQQDDYYCDAHGAGEIPCPEIDVQEANLHSWRSTLHVLGDAKGAGGGSLDKGDNRAGQGDWSEDDFGPAGRCINTSAPFDVAVGFPVDARGSLASMQVKLSQDGSACQLEMNVSKYEGMEEISKALSRGMTPVVSYRASGGKFMTLQGDGQDTVGGCAGFNESSCGGSVGFYNFSVEALGTATSLESGSQEISTTQDDAQEQPIILKEASCPGVIGVGGYGNVSIIPTGWKEKNGYAQVATERKTQVIPQMGGRAYFADTCTEGTYDHEQYIAPNLLGKRIRYTTDLSSAGCGCNAAFYLVSMRQNAKPSDCHDFYCDANSVCGESCAEIDIQEANSYSWHTTMHTASDHDGLGGGYGGGGNAWNGPRDWTADDYAPNPKACITTSLPFNVSAAFHVNVNGTLQALEVTLSQEGHDCELKVRLDSYDGVDELSHALAAGMTPVVSYWSSNDMLWMDGQGEDSKGPCASDSKANCGNSVKFYDFVIENIDSADLRKAIDETLEPEKLNETNTSTSLPTVSVPQQAANLTTSPADSVADQVLNLTTTSQHEEGANSSSENGGSAENSSNSENSGNSENGSSENSSISNFTVIVVANASDVPSNMKVGMELLVRAGKERLKAVLGGIQFQEPNGKFHLIGRNELWSVPPLSPLVRRLSSVATVAACVALSIIGLVLVASRATAWCVGMPRNRSRPLRYERLPYPATAVGLPNDVGRGHCPPPAQQGLCYSMLDAGFDHAQASEQLIPRSASGTEMLPAHLQDIP